MATFMDGRNAHAAGQSIADCPFAPSDPAGSAWRQGWIAAESLARQAAGTFGATTEEKAAAAATLGPEYRPDPVAELLGEATSTDDGLRPGAHVVLLRFDTEQYAAALRQAAESVERLMCACAADLRAITQVFADIATETDQSKKPFVCRRHGPQETHGYCRPCNRSNHRDRQPARARR